jgi:hypothetical protein
MANGQGCALPGAALRRRAASIALLTSHSASNAMPNAGLDRPEGAASRPSRPEALGIGPQYAVCALMKPTLVRSEIE